MLLVMVLLSMLMMLQLIFTNNTITSSRSWYLGTESRDLVAVAGDLTTTPNGWCLNIGGGGGDVPRSVANGTLNSNV